MEFAHLLHTFTLSYWLERQPIKQNMWGRRELVSSDTTCHGKWKNLWKFVSCSPISSKCSVMNSIWFRVTAVQTASGEDQTYLFPSIKRRATRLFTVIINTAAIHTYSMCRMVSKYFNKNENLFYKRRGTLNFLITRNNVWLLSKMNRFNNIELIMKQ